MQDISWDDVTDEELLATEKDQYLSSLYLFAKYCLGYLDLTEATHLPIATALQENTKRKLICVPRGCFKCLTSSSIVYTKTGMRKEIGQINVGEEIMSWESGKMVMSRVVAKEIKFNQPSFKLKFRSGREIEASGNHPFMKISGWTNASELKVGDWLAGWAGKEMEFGHDAPDGHAWLLGMFIGDGSTKHGKANISMFHKPIIEKTIESAKACGFEINEYQKGNFSLKKGSRDFLKSYGIYGEGSWTKKIPEQVWSWSLKSRREFIAAYFSCDAHCDKSNRTILKTVSKDLAYGMADLLKTIGVFSTIKYYKYDYSEFYDIAIIDRTSQINLAKCPIRLKKRPVGISPQQSIYKCVPKEWRLIKKPKQSRIRKGKPRIDNNHATSFDKFNNFSKEIDMEWAATDEMYWDELISIEKSIGSHVDIEVEKTHTFICNGLITHNSSLGSVAYPMWKLLHDPDLRIMIDSELYSNSKNFLREIKGHYENNNTFRKLFGDKIGPVWNESQITVSDRTKVLKEPSITVSGIGANKTGTHVDLIVADDLSSYQNTKNPDLAQKTIDHYRLYTSILNPGGTIVVIGTRYSEIDIIGFIIENELEIKDGNITELKKLYCGKQSRA